MSLQYLITKPHGQEENTVLEESMDSYYIKIRITGEARGNVSVSFTIKDIADDEGNTVQEFKGGWDISTIEWNQKEEDDEPCTIRNVGVIPKYRFDTESFNFTVENPMEECHLQFVKL